MRRSLLTTAVAVAVATSAGCAGTGNQPPPDSSRGSPPAVPERVVDHYPEPLPAEREFETAQPVPALQPSAEDVWIQSANRWTLKLFNQLEEF